jgi:hypothetical protein
VLVQHSCSTVSEQRNPIVFIEGLRKFRTPDANRASRLAGHNMAVIDGITMSILLNLETARIMPIIEDVTSQDTTANTPYTVPAFASKLLVAHHLLIIVIDFVAGVMEIGVIVRRGASEKHAMMTGICGAMIRMHEHENINALIFWSVESVSEAANLKLVVYHSYSLSTLVRIYPKWPSLCTSAGSVAESQPALLIRAQDVHIPNRGLWDG